MNLTALVFIGIGIGCLVAIIIELVQENKKNKK